MVSESLSRPDEAKYVAIIEPLPDGSEECTIFPADATDDLVTTAWLTARTGSFVHLDEMR